MTIIYPRQYLQKTKAGGDEQILMKQRIQINITCPKPVGDIYTRMTEGLNWGLPRTTPTADQSGI